MQNEVRNLVAKAKTKEAIELVISWAQQNNATELQDTIALIKADWLRLTKEENMNIAENANLRRNKINNQILSLDWSIETTLNIPETPEEKRADQPEKTDRGILWISGVKKNRIDNSEPTSVEMVKNARNFTPFKKIEEQIKLLFFSATPRNAGQLNTGLESRFKDIFREFDRKERFKILEEHGISSEKFRNYLIYEDPHILHFGGHGQTEGIALEGRNLEAKVLVDLLGLSENTQCVVLNACNSLEIAKAVAQHIPYVIGTQDKIDDRTAIAFAKGFYIGIVAGISIEKAFKSGLIAIEDEKLPDADVLVLVKGVSQS